MKQHIAHINNTANLPYTIAEEQRKRGSHQATWELLKMKGEIAEHRR